jgi:predicted CopG family antitoxin
MKKTKSVALWESTYERLKKRKLHERQALSEVVDKLLDEIEAKENENSNT